MVANFNLPDVNTLYTAFPTQIIASVDAALQQLSTELLASGQNHTNIPDGAIKWDHQNNKWVKKVNGNFNNHLSATYNFTNLEATQLDLGDGQKVRLGASQDLQLFHGTDNNSIIQDVGAGNLSIQSNGAEVQLAKGGGLTFAHMVRAIVDGAVMLYDSGNERLTTDSNGIQVTSRVGIGGAASHSLDVFGNTIQLGASNTQTQELRVGRAGSGNRNVDFSLIGDNTNSSYGFRITRNQGVNGNSDLKHKGTGNLRIISQDTGTVVGKGEVQFFTQDSVKATLAAGGNFGIGTSSPSVKLHVSSSAATVGLLQRTSTANVAQEFKNNTSSMFCGLTENATGFAIDDDNNLGVDPMFFVQKSNGNVGIGTSSPGVNFEIASNANAQTTATIPTVRLTNSDTTASAADIMGSFEFLTKDASDPDHITAFMRCMSLSNAGVNYDLAFGTKTTNISGDATEKMRITSNGVLGIGTTNPEGKFEVVSDETNGISGFIGGLRNNDNTSAVRRIQFGTTNFRNFIQSQQGSGGDDFTSDNDLLLNPSGGKVGIGITNPDQTLHVHKGSAGSISSDGNAVITIENSSHSILQMLSPNTVSNRIMFGDPDDVNAGEIQYNHQNNNLSVTVASGDAIRINSDREVGIGTTGPTNQLHVYDSANANDTPEVKIESFRPGIRLKDRSSSSASAEIVGDNALKFSVSTPVDDNTALTERMRVDDTGFVGIGTQNPDVRLDVARLGSAWTGQDPIAGTAAHFHNGNNSSTSPAYIGLGAGTASISGINFGDANDADVGRIHYNHSDNSIRFGTSGAAENVRVHNNGYLGIGSSSPDSALHIGSVTNPALTIVGSNFNTNVTYGGRSIQTHVDIRTTSMRGGVLVRNQNDFRSESDHAAFMSYDAFDTSQTTFAFRAALGATLADTFYVKNNGDSYIKTKLGIGTTSPDKTLHVHKGSAGSASSDNNTVITMENNNHCILQMLSPANKSNRIMFGDPEDANAGEIQYDHQNNRLLITTNGDEALRITDDDRKVFIGCITEESGFGGVVIKPDASGNNGSASVVFDRANTTNSSFAFSFENNNVSSGFISYNNSTTTFSSNSDYRLKENAVAISDGITRLKTLKPYRFNFKVDPSTTVDGFFAHEVTAVPEAVTGTKDEVDSDNKPIYQGIDQSKLVPLLVAAVQELITRVETLEAS